MTHRGPVYALSNLSAISKQSSIRSIVMSTLADLVDEVRVILASRGCPHAGPLDLDQK